MASERLQGQRGRLGDVLVSYQPTEPASIDNVEQLRIYVRDELRAIARELSEMEVVDLRTTHRDPIRPREGMIVYADGTDFDPGQGEGLYVYKDGAWTKLAIDYAQGTWTPSIVASTMGNLTVVYGSRTGAFTRIGRLVSAEFNLGTSTFTHTTASGQVTITGLPFAATGDSVGTLAFQGITKANYNQFNIVTANALSELAIECSNSGQSIASLQITDMPTGGSVVMRGGVNYIL